MQLRARRESPFETPPPPAWMFIYGNLMTVLLALFIFFLSLAPSGGGSHGTTHKEGAPGEEAVEENMNLEFGRALLLVHLRDKIKVILKELMAKGQAELLEDKEGYTLRFRNDALFSEGGLRLRPEVEPILLQLANQMALVTNMVLVSGHTDNRPVEASGPYPNNWAVTSAQAAAVVNYFTTKGGLDSVRMQSRGMGEIAPLDSNETDEGRARNRRVEILITRGDHAPPKILPPMPPPPSPELRRPPPPSRPGSGHGEGAKPEEGAKPKEAAKPAPGGDKAPKGEH